MTRKPQAHLKRFDAKLRARSALRRRQLAKTQQKLAECERELRGLKDLMARIDAFEDDLRKALLKKDWPSPGRPGKWKGAHGYEFVAGILDIQAQEKCSVAEAIRKLKKTDPKRWPEKPRDLEARFREIKRYWVPWCQIETLLEAEARDLLEKSKK
jgi:hypothetical protein